MAVKRVDKDVPGPDVWAIGAGWLALVLGMVTLNWAAWERTLTSGWPLRGVIVTAALLLTWLFGYWPRIAASARVWTRRGGLNATMVTVGIILAAIGLNYVFHRYHWRTDLTENKRWSLSDRSRQILKNLKEPVKATAFFYDGSRERRDAENLFKRYRDVSDKFKYEIVNPLEKPQLLQELGMTTDQGVMFQYKGQKQQTPTVGEKEFTSAILKLTREKQPKVYFLQGHGEMGGEGGMGQEMRSLSTVKQMLTDAQWQTEDLFLQGPDAKTPDPADAAVIVIADPLKNLSPDEVKRLNEYLQKGGRLLVTLSPGGPSLEELVKPYGIQVGNDFVYDTRFGGQILIQRPETHEMTRALGMMVLIGVRSVQPAATPPTGVTPQSLLKTLPTTVTIPNYKKGMAIKPNAKGAKTGEATVAALSTRTGTEGKPESRIVVVGSSLSFSDAAVQNRQFFNADFFTNAVNWLGNQTELVSIEPKDTGPKQLAVQPQHHLLLMLIYWVEFPLLAVALGIYIYLKRR